MVGDWLSIAVLAQKYQTIKKNKNKKYTNHELHNCWIGGKIILAILLQPKKSSSITILNSFQNKSKSSEVFSVLWNLLLSNKLKVYMRRKVQNKEIEKKIKRDGGRRLFEKK